MHQIFITVGQAQLYKFETNNLNLIYTSKAHEYVVPYVARAFENSLGFESRFFNYKSAEKITLFFQDFSDFGNAGAIPIPHNYIRLYMAPFSYVYETTPANERMNWLMNHELVHIVASDKASDSDQFFRSLFFGKVNISSENPESMIYSYMTNPRLFSPRWYHEGTAVFFETWMAGGLGRALGSYDEMVFRTMVRDSSYIYNFVGLESEGTTIDFHMGVNSYLYGTRFISYLAYQYGPDKIIDWISKTEDRSKYFSSDFENIYSNSLDSEWHAWIEWEKRFQKSNLDSIRQHPTTPSRSILDRALGSVSRGYYDKLNKKLYVAVKRPAQIPYLSSIDLISGFEKKICNLTGTGMFYVTSLAYDPENNYLFYTTDNNDWRDLNKVDIQTGNSEVLIKDARTGDLCFNRNDKSVWGIRHQDGISTIVRIPYPYKEWNQIYSWPFGQDMYDLDISPDGKVLTGALVKINGDQLLIKMSTDSLLNSNTSYDMLINFGNSTPANFTFSDDGNYLYGSSYLSGVSNIFRYNLSDDDIVVLSNAETGFFRPIPISSDSLLIFRYTDKGFVPALIPNKQPEEVSAIQFLGYKIVDKYPIVKDWVADSPAKVNIDSITVYNGIYSPLKNLSLNSIYPVILGYKEYAAIGVRADLMDLLGVVTLSGRISYSPYTNLSSDERLHADLKFRYWGWQLNTTYNQADFYDLFGPTKTSRKGYSLGLQYDQSIIYEKPRLLDLNVNVTAYADLDRLPFFQNVVTPVDRFITFGASLKYSYLLRTQGAVEEECGFGIDVISYNYYANSEYFPHLLFNVNYGILLPIDHSSLWLRSSFGISRGDRDISFSNYYLGGFGNNWIDDKSVSRYREFYSFPGVKLNSIEAQNYLKLMMEWPLPPIRFREAGFTNMYLNWARLSFFTTGILEDVHYEAYKSMTANLGIQLDFKLIFFTHMSTTLSLGYAGAFHEGQKLSNEFMISLKIL